MKDKDRELWLEFIKEVKPIEKNIINIRPTQKLGKLNPRIEKNIINLLAKLFAYIPAITPTGIPTTIDKNNEIKANSKVAGNLWNISSIAGIL